jgi:hypothetical protein
VRLERHALDPRTTSAWGSASRNPVQCAGWGTTNEARGPRPTVGTAQRGHDPAHHGELPGPASSCSLRARPSTSSPGVRADVARRRSRAREDHGRRDAREALADCSWSVGFTARAGASPARRMAEMRDRLGALGDEPSRRMAPRLRNEGDRTDGRGDRLHWPRSRTCVPRASTLRSTSP